MTARINELLGMKNSFVRGSLTMLLGPSSCGKTTLQMITSFYEPDEGAIYLNEQ